VRIRAAEVALLFAAGVVLALVATWPLALHLASRVPQDPGDPLLQAWQVAWDGHALLDQPLHFFQANNFWPLHDTLAFSDSLIGYAPAGIVGSGTEAAVVRYDLLFLGAIALAFAATYLLCRELGVGRLAAACGGLACAYGPWRLGQEGHLHVVSVGGIPLALFLLLRGYRRRSGPQIVAGWLVVAWQLSIGFTLGLQLFYLLVAIGVALLIRWLRGGRPAIDRSIVVPTAIGVGAFVVTVVVIARPYLRVLNDHPEAHRTIPEVSKLSPPIRALLAAAPDNLVWGGITSSVRNGLTGRTEQLLFPGLATVLLAGAGIRSMAYSLGTRRVLVAVVLVSLVFALGFSLWGDWSPYRLLWELAPGWRGIRAPGRIFALTALGLAVLAAAGAERLLSRAPTPRHRWAIGAALLVAIGLDGFGPIPTAHVPVAPQAIRLARPPLFALPSEARYDTIYEFWSTDGFPALVNGFSGFPPHELLELRRATLGFPNAPSVALLRARGVRSVVVPRRFAAPLRWHRAIANPVQGLGVTRRFTGDGVLFTLAPPVR